MMRLRTEVLDISVPLLYNIKAETFKILFHNVRSLRLHFDDVQCDYNVQAAEMSIFVQTALCHSDPEENYQLNGFRFFRNDILPENNTRTCYGTAVYMKNKVCCVCPPMRANVNDVEMTVTVVSGPVSDLHVVGIYRSKSKVNLKRFIDAIDHLNDVIADQNTPTVILGDFNVNLLEMHSDSKALTKCLVEKRGYTQLITKCTTDYCSLLDHIYTNIPDRIQSSGVLESYFSDHKPVFVCFY